MDTHVLWLGRSDCHDAGKVGGKAANLSRLAADFNVPPGFCLVREVQSQVMDGHNLPGPESDGVGPPEELLTLVSGAYEDLGKLCGVLSPSVAVRSSAVDEDGQSSSFAGQYDTYLNLSGFESISHAVMRCWASADGDRMQSYRLEHNLDSDSGGVAVLIQQLVPASASGVVFSANPINGTRDEIMINATWGLGESVVSGTVTPDTLVVRRADASIIDAFIGPKNRMTVRSEQGTKEVDVPTNQRQVMSLNDQQISELTDLATSLEKKMGWPVDLEFAYQDQELYLLQCRPITTL